MQQVDVEQTFGQMAWRTQGFLAVRAIIGFLVEFLKDREHPFTIIEEDFLLHDEHIAEARLVAIEEILRILLIIRIHGAQNLITALQIVIVQQGSGLPQCARSAVLIDDFFEIAEWRGDDVILLHHVGDALVIQSILLCRIGIDVVINDFAECVFLVRGLREVKVTTVMAESIVVCVNVLPCPLLRD